jgi:oligopeptide/dipeptide ABC transporter ATP-binding protein
MYLGQLVEVADRNAVYERPAHPYTHSLLSAIPIADPQLERRRKRIVLQGDLPSPASPPAGCRFHTRCPIVQERCMSDEPKLMEIAPGHEVACHYHLKEGEYLIDAATRLGRQVVTTNPDL